MSTIDIKITIKIKKIVFAKTWEMFRLIERLGENTFFYD